MIDTELQEKLGYSKYSKWYLNIIFKAKSENRKKLKKDNPNYTYYENHHILPSSLFPEYKDLRSNKWNGVLLTYREHILIHYLIYKHYKKLELKNEHFKMSYALHGMLGRNKKKTKYFKSRFYQDMKIDMINLSVKSTVSCTEINSNEKVRISSKEYYKNKDKYIFHTKNLVYVFDTLEHKWCNISTNEFHSNKNRFLTPTTSKVSCIHNITKEFNIIPIEIYYNNLTLYTVYTGEYVHVFDMINVEYVNIPKPFYENNKDRYISIFKKEVIVLDTYTNKRIKIPKEFYKNNKNRFKSDLNNTKNLYDKRLKKNRRISEDEFQLEPERYIAFDKGMVMCIDVLKYYEKNNKVKIKKEIFISNKRYIGPSTKYLYLINNIYYRATELTTIEKKKFKNNRVCLSECIDDYISKI